MTNTMKELRDILEEQFGPERTAALKDDDKPWHEKIGAKTIDILDFKLFVQEKFNVYPHAFFFDETSLNDVVAYIDEMQPSTNAH